MVFKIKWIISLVLFMTSFLSAQRADDIIGDYHLPNNLDIKLFKHNDKYYGKIIALNGYENGITKDLKNPDKSRQNDPLIGKVIIEGLEFDLDDKEWVNGRMYAPQKGMMVNLQITEMRENEIEVVGSKYFFWKTLTWQKI